jgi:hypothetical protein
MPTLSVLPLLRQPPRLLHGVLRIAQEFGDQAERRIIAMTLLRVLHAQHGQLECLVALAGAAVQAPALEPGQRLGPIGGWHVSAVGCAVHGDRPRVGLRPDDVDAACSASPNYRDQAGNTWSGMGPQPRGLKEAVAAGISLEQLAA